MQEGNDTRSGFAFTIRNWENIENGKTPDHFDVGTVLKEFNDITSCTGKAWRINKEDCTGGAATCQSLY